ncbi:AAA family ATPase [Azohydromonas lata]|uniref:G domain-containing protein n=1 Tax=Azohydromonas lata TaxID=45677 RepID=A0ABU5I882_9BURK|nr:hypothetical protein [Azohydromonas lata]MDZ5455297.1 hypothetical protein [Azohydromonas lata]
MLAQRTSQVQSLDLPRKTQNNNPAYIYDEIIASVQESIDRITQSPSPRLDHESVAHEKEKALALLNDYKLKISGALEELRSLAEWDVFTISMYGETNAGKSTIIETLRILLGEPSKRETQAKFRSIAQRVQFNGEHIATLQDRLKAAAAQKQLSEQDLQALRLRHSGAEDGLQQRLKQLKSDAQHKRSALSLWQKIFHLFKKLEEEKQLADEARNLQHLQAQHRASEHEYQARIDDAGAQAQRHKQELACIQDSLAQLAPLQDGSIIGNGHSDFTLESQSYHFDVQGQKITLLDVPGIEGEESKVSEAINGAVKKSHAVLYITRKPSPPNKGEGNQLGTLEKIRQHLGSQTEVWAVYNKGITNPMALRGPQLLNDGESASLQDLEKELRAQLGDSYQGCISLSSLPAFYSATDCLLPTNSHYKNRQKFLAGMDAEALLEKSNFSSFVRFISQEICRGYKEKIHRSNVRKIQVGVQDGQRMLDEMFKTFSTARQNLSKQHKSTTRELDNLEDAIARRIKSRCRDRLAEAKTKKRQAIYCHIEDDLSNDDFKLMLESTIDALKTELVEDLQEALHAEVEVFEAEIKEVVTRFKKNADEILELNINRHFGAGPGHFALEFKIDNGINTFGLLSSLGGATAMIWAAFFSSNPLGWTLAAALGAVTLIFSLYKSVRSFFSTSYKMEQQRKSADENLAKVFDKIEDMLDERLAEAAGEMKQTIDKLKQQLSAPLHSVMAVIQALQTASKDMAHIESKIA